MNNIMVFTRAEKYGDYEPCKWCGLKLHPNKTSKLDQNYHIICLEVKQKIDTLGSAHE